jgi:hypothetical protein
VEGEQEPLVYRGDVVIIMTLLGDILAELRGIREDLRENGDEEEEF